MASHLQESAMIIFSDLDGTLLDHASYDWRAAEPALDRLRAAGIPLVLASSKTAAEIAPLRAEIGFAHCPAIVENGAGVLPPDGSAGGTGEAGDYRRLRAILDRAPDDLRTCFKGFGDLGIDGIAAATSLDPQSAARAGDRRFSEPGLWSGDDASRQAFVTWLADQGVSARSGGRFLTLSFGGTKAGRMAEIKRVLLGDETAFTVALGDAPNDIEMLEAADRGFIVANPHGTPMPEIAGENEGRVTRTPKPGPAGWNEAVLSIVST